MRCMPVLFVLLELGTLLQCIHIFSEVGTSVFQVLVCWTRKPWIQLEKHQGSICYVFLLHSEIQIALFRSLKKR